MTTTIARNGLVPGQYVPTLDRRAKNGPCPHCGVPIEKISHLVGSCYVCPSSRPAE